jgi:hypothetical protein
MRKLNAEKTFIIFLIAWFVINMLQAIFTEMTNDEAYYMLYGKYLSWGYFDHPPMVALITRISSVLFSGNLGVRFITVLLQIATLFLVWLQLKQQVKTVAVVVRFFTVAASIVMFSAYGFITTPDVPLLFFTALFLFGYQQFIQKSSWPVVLLLAVAMSGLVYSKYQAVLVIGLVVLSNIRLLVNYKFWLAGVGALLLLIPHFVWQYVNDFPTFQYHLVDRSAGFQWKYLFEYFPNQLAVFNPFTFVAVVYVLVKYRTTDLMERAQYFLIIGFIGTFWFTAFRGHVEPHWTIACAIPMIVLLVNKAADDDKLAKYIGKYVAYSLVLILIIRILLTTNVLPTRLGFNGKLNKYKAIENVAGDKPVIFIGSFQHPSLYRYFTGKEATVISSLRSRQTQFDFWQFEQNYLNKPVFVCVPATEKSQKHETNGHTIEGFFTDNLQVTNRLKIKFLRMETTMHAGDTIAVLFDIHNPTTYPVDFRHAEFPVEIGAVFLKGKGVNVQSGELVDEIRVIKPKETLTNEIKFVVPDLPVNTYQFGLSLNSFFGPTLNSNFIKVKLK